MHEGKRVWRKWACVSHDRPPSEGPQCKRFAVSSATQVGRPWQRIIRTDNEVRMVSSQQETNLHQVFIIEGRWLWELVWLVLIGSNTGWFGTKSRQSVNFKSPRGLSAKVNGHVCLVRPSSDSNVTMCSSALAFHFSPWTPATDFSNLTPSSNSRYRATPR